MRALHARAPVAARRWGAALLLAAAIPAACGGGRSGEAAAQGPGARTLTLGAYTTPREVYGRRIIPAFRAHWKATTGQELRVEESYLGSGAQARAIAGGFEADVAALSLEPDLESLRESGGGLLQHDWKQGPGGGMASRSVVVIAVRAGNPKGIRNWDDLRRPGVEVLAPNPKTSGGAMWNVAALYGAALRGATSVAAGDSAGAEALLRDVLRNVLVMDKGARESIITFERGVGDAAITYENEVIVARKAGRKVDYVIPRATILIENPVAVVDAYVDRHGTRDVAEAFVRFLATPAAQRAFAEYGLRPSGDDGATALPPVPGLFTIADLGGWPTVTRALFRDGGVFDRASARAVAGR